MDPTKTAAQWQAKSLALTNVLLNRIYSGTESVPLAVLLEMEIPEIVRSYATLRARKLLARTKPVRLEDDGSHHLLSAEVRRQLQILKECLVRETVFTRAELEEIVAWAITFYLQVLVRPRQKIMEVLFRNSSVAVRDTVVTLLRGFGDQRAFVRKLLNGVDDLELEAIDAESFDALARLTEKNVFAETPVTAFLADANLLLELESEVAGTRKERLSSADLSGLLVERGLHAVLLRAQPALHERTRWTLAEIESSLAPHLFVNGKRTQRYIAPVRARKTKTRVAAAPSQTALFDFSDEESRLIAVTEGPACLIEPAKLSPGNGGDNPVGSQAAVANGPEVKVKAGTLNLTDQEDLLIRNVFYNSEQEYRSFLARLDALGNSKGRRAALEQELLERDVSPFSQEAALLTELVSARFKKDENL